MLASFAQFSRGRTRRRRQLVLLKTPRFKRVTYFTSRSRRSLYLSTMFSRFALLLVGCLANAASARHLAQSVEACCAPYNSEGSLLVMSPLSSQQCTALNSDPLYDATDSICAVALTVSCEAVASEGLTFVTGSVGQCSASTTAWVDQAVEAANSGGKQPLEAASMRNEVLRCLSPFQPARGQRFTCRRSTSTFDFEQVALCYSYIIARCLALFLQR